MPRMMTSAAAIMALSLGMPALAADEQPKMDPAAQAEAAASGSTQPEESWTGEKPEETAESGGSDSGTSMDTEQTAETDASGDDAAMETEQSADTSASGDDAAMETEQSADTGASGDDATMETEQSADTSASGDDAAMEGEQAAETGATGDDAAMEGEQAAETGMTEGDAADAEQPEQAATDTETETGADTEAQTATGSTAGDTVGSGGASEEVDWTQHIGKPLMSPDGEELGEISEVVAGPDGDTMVIIARGGFLGLGKKQYAMMPQDLNVEGDQVTASMTQDQVAEMPEYEEPEPTE